MSKNTRILSVIIVVLVAVIGITAYINKGNVEEMKVLNNQAVFIIMENGQEVASLKMDEISKIGETTFYANLKKSGKDPIKYEYTGVLLKDIFEEVGISLKDKEVVVVTAADGYAVSVDIEKIMENDNVYLAYKKEGKLIGTKEEGGKGPYQMIISKDQFSQYWCKFALSADVK